MEERTRDRLVRPVRLDPTGRLGPTRGQARSRRRWRRTSHGFYVPASVDGDRPEQRILEASVLVPPGQAVTGWAALRWLGGAWFGGSGAVGARLPVTLLISTHDIRAQPGIELSGEGAAAEDIVVVDGVAVTTPAWSAAFLARRSDSLRAAVTAIDMAAYSDLVSLAEIAEVLQHQSGWTGVPQAREALARATENAWSPREVAMRMSWEAAFEGARPLPNVPLFDLTGRHIGTPDLVDVARGVAGEYDGLVHLGRDQRRADRTRDERFAAHGIQLVRWLSGDRPGDFLARLARAYDAAAAVGGSRSWSADPPRGWVSTTTVDARRALTPSERDRLLRYRER